MNTWSVVIKVGVALLAVAGAVFVVAKYGDKIVAWAKKLIHKAPCHVFDCDSDCDCDCECVEEAPAAEETDFEG